MRLIEPPDIGRANVAAPVGFELISDIISYLAWPCYASALTLWVLTNDRPDLSTRPSRMGAPGEQGRRKAPFV